jgi:hypothetical protein
MDLVAVQEHRVVPGSHRGPVLAAYAGDDFSGSRDEEGEDSKSL